MTNRRGFLGVLAASPFVGRGVADQMMQQTGIASGIAARNGLSGGAEAAGMVGNVAKGHSGKPTHEVWREIFKQHPALLAEQESLLFEQELRPSFIDPDIAVFRSFSFNAKLAFQRQRNVSRRLKEIQNPPWYTRTDELYQRVAGFFK